MPMVKVEDDVWNELMNIKINSDKKYKTISDIIHEDLNLRKKKNVN